MRSHWVRGSPAPPAPLPCCGPCGSLHVCLGNTLGGTGLKPVPTNAMKDRAAGRPHPQPRSRAAGLAVASTSVSEIARRDGVETRPYQRGERQSCGSPAPPAPLPRCGPCGGLHVCLRNTLGGTGLKPVPTNAMKDRAAGRPHPQPHSRAAGAEGGWGEGEGAGGKVRATRRARSTDTATVSLTMMEVSWSRLIKSPGF